MDHPQWVTVFRSADSDAGAEAAAARDRLVESGLSAQLFDDSAPGVPAGAFEVRVPAEEAQRADAILASEQSEAREPGDTSHALDLVTALSSYSETEALSARGVLEASGIPTVLVGASVYPNLPWDLRVPREALEEVRRILAESRADAASGADEAESSPEGASS